MRLGRIRSSLSGLIAVGCLLASFGLLEPVPAEDARSASPGEALPAAGRSGMVASANVIATEVGLEILKKGGNAVDAAVATAFALGVVEPYASGIGGGGFMLVYLADRGVAAAIDFRETAPGHVRPQVLNEENLKTGPLSVAVPGTVAGFELALSRYGTMDLKKVLAPAIRLAEKGFVANGLFCRFVQDMQEKISKCPETVRLYLKPKYKEGDRVYMLDLAGTYRKIAQQGADAFYRGEIAEAICREIARTGGWLDRTDLEGYKAVERRPLRGTYRDHEIISVPPPGSGGALVIELLNILEGYGRAVLENPARRIEVLADALAWVFSDRARYMGDPDFVSIPVGKLVSKDYARELRSAIGKAEAGRRFSAPPSRHESDQTTHVSVADSRGNLVSLTQTLNTFFGSGITVPGTGIILNNEMSDFDFTGTNEVRPGKRPASSITPTIVLRKGQPFMSIGMAGASRIVSGVAEIIMNVIDFGMNIQEAIDAPRIYAASGKIAMESRFAPEVIKALAHTGYAIESRAPFDLYFGGAQGLTVDSKAGMLFGGADPRRLGSAAGY